VQVSQHRLRWRNPEISKKNLDQRTDASSGATRKARLELAARLDSSMSDTYCAAVRSGRLHAVHTHYHDLEYGFPLWHDDALFERLTAVFIYIEKICRSIFSIPIPPLFVSTRVKLCLHRVTHVGRDARRSPLVKNPRFLTRVKFAMILEINQAGLSWGTILKKREGFKLAYANFKLEAVAAFAEDDVARLLADAGIIRNRLKVLAAIKNAKRILELQRDHGSFLAWLEVNHPNDLAAWCVLFKKTFVFTGGEIVREFLTSTGFLPGAHDPDCPCHTKILELDPAWARASTF
jgi:DNA-3-methyladenine glycosylase I